MKKHILVATIALAVSISFPLGAELSENFRQKVDQDLPQGIDLSKGRKLLLDIIFAQRFFGITEFKKRAKNPGLPSEVNSSSIDDSSKDPTTQLVIHLFPSASTGDNPQGQGSIDLKDDLLNAALVRHFFEIVLELTGFIDLIESYTLSQDPQEKTKIFTKLKEKYPEYAKTSYTKLSDNTPNINKIIQTAFSASTASTKALSVMEKITKRAVDSNKQSNISQDVKNRIRAICKDIYASIRQEKRVISLVVDIAKSPNILMYPTGYTSDIISAFACKILNDDEAVQKELTTPTSEVAKKKINEGNAISEENIPVPFAEGKPISNSKIKVTIQDQEIEISDCVETMIRQLLAIACSNSKKHYQQIDTSKFFPGKLKTFLESKINEKPVTPWRMANDSSDEFRKKWAIVCSGFTKEASYRRISVGLIADLDNIVYVLWRLAREAFPSMKINGKNLPDETPKSEYSEGKSDSQKFDDIITLLFYIQRQIFGTDSMFIVNTPTNFATFQVSSKSGNVLIKCEIQKNTHTFITEVKNIRPRPPSMDKQVTNNWDEFPILQYYYDVQHSENEEKANNALDKLDALGLCFATNKSLLLNNNIKEEIKKRISKKWNRTS
ncbi:MAG: hypothetical protein LBT70_00245 [Holosporaceae bacterium]|nr:hypothetical protein [Holosporaceae bacterium]